MLSTSANDQDAANKKRRLPRACDYCRRKKVKCDGPDKPNNRCSRCIARRMECTYQDSIRGHYPNSYVQTLESRLERMEKLVSQLYPDDDTPAEFEGVEPEKEATVSTPSDAQQSTSHHGSKSTMSPTSLAVTPQTPASSDDFESSDEDESGVQDGAGGAKNLSSNPQAYRYHGKSSGLVFVRTAIDLKNEYAGRQEANPARTFSRRDPWLRPTTEDETVAFQDFPPDDLLDVLVNLYFRSVNDVTPLLHEPTFKRNIEEGLHLRHRSFGATVLLVCANASRFTSDRRVLLDDTDCQQSAGWRYFEQVESVRRLPLAPAQLYDLQVYALMAMFVQGSRAPQATWTLVGIGLRIAIDVGAHRRKMYSSTPTVEGELWRRAFWVLVQMEWMTGYGLGRPASIHDEDIDLGLPIEVDDEYWTTPDGQPLFKQPPDKPSGISFFVSSIRLGQILAFASRTIYSINKSKSQLGQGDSQWERRIVAELDSALNKWSHSLPEHVRWDPNRTDTVALTQSTHLNVQFYLFQIAVHRPFISAAKHNSALAFPSLIICTNAARSCIQSAEVLYQRTGSPHYRNMGLLFMCGIVLMMNILGQKRAGRLANVEKDIAIVRKCVEMMRTVKNEMHVTQTLCDMLQDLVSATESSQTAAERAPGQVSSLEELVMHPVPTNFKSRNASKASRSQATLTPRSGDTNAPAQGSSSQQRAPSSCGVTTDAPLVRQQADTSAPHVDSYCELSAFPGIPQDSAQGHPRQYSDPTPSAPTNDVQVSSSDMQTDENVFTMSDSMFGLEPLGYSEAVSLLPSVNDPASVSVTRHPQPQTFAAQMPSQGDGPQQQDFAMFDDTLAMWSNAPPYFGWDDWEAYFNAAGDRPRPET